MACRPDLRLSASGRRAACRASGVREITGLVTDRSGAALPGATVTLTDVGTHRLRVVVTTTDGVYGAVGLLPGIYQLRVTLTGFATVVQDQLQVTTGQKIRLDLTLVVGHVSEEVTVRGETPVLRGESASLGAVVEQRQVAELPLNGRTFISLAALAPGVALPPGSQLPRINGGRPRTNEYLFDGISVLQPPDLKVRPTYYSARSA